MSWSVSAKGTIAEVNASLDDQFNYPLADPPAGLADEGERETVRRIRETIKQCLETFGPERTVSVAANGHIAFEDYEKKTGARQTVSVTITPG